MAWWNGYVKLTAGAQPAITGLAVGCENTLSATAGTMGMGYVASTNTIHLSRWIGIVSVGENIGTVVLDLEDAYHLINLGVDKSDGYSELWVDNVLKISGTPATYPGSTNLDALFGVRGGGGGGKSGNAFTARYKHVIITDESDNGDGMVGRLDLINDYAFGESAPNADYDVNWTPSAGTDHYALVDELPESGSDYVTRVASVDEEWSWEDSAPPAGKRLVAVVFYCSHHTASGQWWSTQAYWFISSGVGLWSEYFDPIDTSFPTPLQVNLSWDADTASADFDSIAAGIQGVNIPAGSTVWAVACDLIYGPEVAAAAFVPRVIAF